jgi:hypothetical protein
MRGRLSHNPLRGFEIVAFRITCWNICHQLSTEFAGDLHEENVASDFHQVAER